MSKHFLLPVILLLQISCSSNILAQKISENLPNVILIITDDQGHGDLGFHGNPDIKTPVLDAFAKASTRFTNFYVSPVCAPTRASLMTGRYSLRTGVYDTYNGGAMMATEEKTIAEFLKESGYKTSMSGKWHLGDNYPMRPMDQGFDYALYHRAGGMAQVGDAEEWDNRETAYFDPILIENGKKVQKTGYCSDVFTDATLDFIEKNKEHPFFCYLSFNAPHTPLQLPEEYEAMYANLEIDTSKYPSFERPFPKLSKSDLAATKKIYGMVSNIDDNIGRLLKKLEDLKLRENTLVIFMTDNGPQQWRYTSGFRARKGSVYEGGIHVPFFIQYPAKFSKDVAIETPVAHFDILPTLLEFCGMETPNNLDGKSLMPLINGQSVDWSERPLFFHWQRGFPEPYQNIAVRKDHYKFVGNTGPFAKTEHLELYDLSKDPGELHNLATTNPKKTEELKAGFDKWYREIMESPNLDNVRIHLGSEAENPVQLNRNDAKGSFGIWAEKEIYGYWDIHVEQSGMYEVSCFFKEKLDADGTATIRIDRMQRSAPVKAGSNSITFQKVHLTAGDAKLEAGFRNGKTWKVEFPFYLEVKKVD